MARAHILGWPRIGARREWAFASEACKTGKISEPELHAMASQLREDHWRRQEESGFSWITAGDFAYHDQVLSHSILLGSIPERFGFDARNLTLAQHFELASGNADNAPMKTAQWFGTRYRYVVPELELHTPFDGGANQYFDEIEQALACEKAVKPVLIGPVSYLWLAGTEANRADRLQLLSALLDRYFLILKRLGDIGVEWVQFDEPILCRESDRSWLEAIDVSYRLLTRAGLKILLATYLGDASAHVRRVLSLPVQGIHIDCVSAPQQLRSWLDWLPPDMLLSAGVIDATNVWRSDLRALLKALTPAHDRLGDRLLLAPSASLLHSPVSLAVESGFDSEVRSWLAFAEEKLQELALLTRAFNEGEAAVAAELENSDQALQAYRHSQRVNNQAVCQRLQKLTPEARKGRRELVGNRELSAPGIVLGAQPATRHGREMLAALRRGSISDAQFREHRRTELRLALKHRELFGKGSLVRKRVGAEEVAYFAERLNGFLTTNHGWVQCEGSACIKPPILLGDVSRREPLLLDVVQDAQALIDTPIQIVLLGPSTLLAASFVRDNNMRDKALLQLALALRNEVEDLERAGVNMITIDEGVVGGEHDQTDDPELIVRAFRMVSGAAHSVLVGMRLSYDQLNNLLPHLDAFGVDKITVDAKDIDNALPMSAFDVFQFSDIEWPKKVSKPSSKCLDVVSLNVRFESGDDGHGSSTLNAGVTRPQISETL